MARVVGTGCEGLLLLDKPPGPTSHDVVDRVRRATGQRRAGHTGTLDPMASGLLALVLGRATRLARFLPGSPKLYMGSLELGWTSTTDDVTGQLLSRHEGLPPDFDAVRAAAAELVGSGLQVPPAYSARKVGGQRLYQLARRGVTVRAMASPVEVSLFEVAATDRPELYRFSAEVSSGTYIRSLARDLGHRLGCGAVLASLRRMRVGPLALDSALQLMGDGPTLCRQIEQALIPLESMPLEPPPLRLDSPDAARRFTQGSVIHLDLDVESMLQGPCCVFGPNGELLGVAERQDGLLHPRVVLPPKGPVEGVKS